MAINRELRGRIQAAAWQLIEEKLAAEGGPALLEKRFVEIEDEACEVADALAQEIMRLMAARQAEAVSDLGSAGCPSCQRVSQREEPERRRLQTRRGDVAWQEPSYYCGQCRKSFFPSVPDAGH